MGALPKFEPTPMPTGIAEVTVINGRQAVLLPANMHIDATSLNVVQDGTSLSMKPVKKKLTHEEMEAWLADMNRFQKELGDFMPEGRSQPPMPDGDDIEF